VFAWECSRVIIEMCNHLTKIVL